MRLLETLEIHGLLQLGLGGKKSTRVQGADIDLLTIGTERNTDAIDVIIGTSPNNCLGFIPVIPFHSNLKAWPTHVEYWGKPENELEF